MNSSMCYYMNYYYMNSSTWYVEMRGVLGVLWVLALSLGPGSRPRH